MSIINLANLNEFSSQIWSKIKRLMNGYLHKSEDSLVSGKVTFKDAYILGAKICEVNNTRAIHLMNNDTSYFTCIALTVPANTKINKITIAVDNNKQIGEIITGVNIGFLKASNKEVLKYAIKGGTAVVHKNSDASILSEKVITISLEEIFSENVIVMVGANSAKWGNRNWPLGGHAFGGSTLPEVGTTLKLNTGNYIGQVIVYASDLHINSLFSQSGQNGHALNSINNIPGIDGNLTLALNADGRNINLTANNQSIATLPIITDQEVNDIINLLS